ncbi:protein spire isoform X1 [Diachasma alloeum]|uniref:protein spire isoform X1 n=1 Tax=Diachasma alloeum TaxID=454923 RepID=UPI00073820A5|nr:protein spire isoform X1 [Diachasma alloeum]
MEMNESEERFKSRDRGTRRSRGQCKLSDNDTMTLEETLLSFNGPIGQEQAWAVCHQTAKFLSQLPSNRLQELQSLSQIHLHKEGHILLELPVGSEVENSSEKKVILSLGVLIYQALDFGLDQKEERLLALDLKDLMNLMGSCHEDYESDERLQETDDEGIGRDSEVELDEDNGSYGVNRDDYCSLKHIIQMCARHIQGTDEQADTHYRAVIRAFVHEALELSQFLEKVGGERFQANLRNLPSTERYGVSSQHLDTMDFDDWTDIRIWRAIQARFWVQVIGELRHGIKLKKVEENLKKRGRVKDTGAEFELTPYEILMDDIRERRYNLRKTSGPVRNVRKDARAVVLEFIRSRPPLKKASDRQLPPRKKESTIRELLMESIKKPPRPLRSCRERQLKEQKPIEPPQSNSTTASTNPDPSKPPKKLIPVDFDLKLDGEEDSDSDDDPDDVYAVTRFEDDKDPHRDECSHEDDEEKGSANPWRKTGGLRLTRNEYHRFCDAQLESYDLATQCPSRRASVRKHRGPRNIAPSFIPLGTCSVPHSRPQSRISGVGDSMKMSLSPSPNVSPSMSPRPRERTLLKANTTVDPNYNPPQEKKPSLGDMLLDERLSLTLEEIVHIRSVLTKAELESLPVEGRVKEDVEKRRVCFLCLKTRFGLLGPWGQRCRLCERTVCVKCYSKMRIPTEHFAHVPVVLLSPGLLMSPGSEDSSRGWPRPGGAVGSAPASPAHRRRDNLSNHSGTPLSTPNPATPAEGLTPRDEGTERIKYPRVGGSPSRMTSSATGSLGVTGNERLVAERMRGVSMVVCHDCRIMVIQIIKSSRSTRATIRNNVISRLTLNLSPAYV